MYRLVEANVTVRPIILRKITNYITVFRNIMKTLFKYDRNVHRWFYFCLYSEVMKHF